MRQPKVLVVVQTACQGRGGKAEVKAAEQGEEEDGVAASAANAYLDMPPAEEAC